MTTVSTSRRVLVTGGGRGLGRAIALELARNGHRVGVLARTESEVLETARIIKEEGGRGLGLVADVLNRRQLEDATRRFQIWAGGCDDLICSAGCFRGIGPVEQVDPDLWWRDIETALRGAHEAIRATLPSIREGGHGTIQLLIGPGFNGELAQASGYGCAQAALVRLAETLGKELAPHVHVYAVNPGLVPTEMTNYLVESVEGRRWLPRFTEAFGEGKETDAEVVAVMSAWLVAERPLELSGRVVAALATPEILATRLARIKRENVHLLRLS